MLRIVAILIFSIEELAQAYRLLKKPHGDASSDDTIQMHRDDQVIGWLNNIFAYI